MTISKKKCGSGTGSAASSTVVPGKTKVPAPARPRVRTRRREDMIIAGASLGDEKVRIHGNRQCHGGDCFRCRTVAIRRGEEEVAPGDIFCLRRLIAHEGQ